MHRTIGHFVARQQWIGIPNAGKAENGARFVPRENNGEVEITVSSPDDATIELMRSVAAKFGGKVIGDEGEEY